MWGHYIKKQLFDSKLSIYYLYPLLPLPFQFRKLSNNITQSPIQSTYVIVSFKVIPKNITQLLVQSCLTNCNWLFLRMWWFVILHWRWSMTFVVKGFLLLVTNMGATPTMVLLFSIEQVIKTKINKQTKILSDVFNTSVGWCTKFQYFSFFFIVQSHFDSTYIYTIEMVYIELKCSLDVGRIIIAQPP